MNKKQIVSLIASNILSIALATLFIFYVLGASCRGVAQPSKPAVTFIPGKRISPGRAVPPSNLISKKQFEQTLKDLTDAKKLIKVLKQKGHKPKVIVKTKILVKQKIVYRTKTDYVEKNIAWKVLRHSNGLLLGKVGYKVNDPEPWHVVLNPLVLDVDLIIARKPGSIDRVAVNAYFLEGKKRIPAPIEKSQTLILPAHQRWALTVTPSLSLGVALGIRDSTYFGGTLAFNWLEVSYEKPVFRFLSPEVGYMNGLFLGGQLVAWNLGQVIPVFKDLWIAIGVGYLTPHGTIGLLTLNTTL